MWQMIAPSLTDVKELISVDYEEVSRSLFSQSAGFFVGSLLGGMVFEWCVEKAEVIMAGGVSMGAIGKCEKIRTKKEKSRGKRHLKN